MTDETAPRLRPPFLHSDQPAPAPDSVGPRSADWTKQEWREFNWKSAASLRAPEKIGVKAEREWDATEWDDPLNPVSQEARRVAEQLIAVAERIRKGELSVDGTASTPETAMAAVLEALSRGE